MNDIWVKNYARFLFIFLIETIPSDKANGRFFFRHKNQHGPIIQFAQVLADV